MGVEGTRTAGVTMNRYLEREREGYRTNVMSDKYYTRIVSPLQYPKQYDLITSKIKCYRSLGGREYKSFQ